MDVAPNDVLGRWGSVLRLLWNSREIFAPFFNYGQDIGISEAHAECSVSQTMISFLIVPLHLSRDDVNIPQLT